MATGRSRKWCAEPGSVELSRRDLHACKELRTAESAFTKAEGGLWKVRPRGVHQRRVRRGEAKWEGRGGVRRGEAKVRRRGLTLRHQSTRLALNAPDVGNGTGQSVVQIGGTRWPSVALGSNQWHSFVNSVAISGIRLCLAAALGGTRLHSMTLGGSRWQSVAVGGSRWQSSLVFTFGLTSRPLRHSRRRTTKRSESGSGGGASRAPCWALSALDAAFGAALDAALGGWRAEIDVKGRRREVGSGGCGVRAVCGCATI